MSDRWQQEIAETVFDAINQDADKMEQKRRQKERIDDSEDCTQLWAQIAYTIQYTSCICAFSDVP